MSITEVRFGIQIRILMFTIIILFTRDILLETKRTLRENNGITRRFQMKSRVA